MSTASKLMLFEAMVRSEDECCRRPLHHAVEHLRVRSVHVLLSVVPTAPLLADSNGLTAAHLCVRSALVDVILPLLLDACPAVAAVKDLFGHSPLHAAVEVRHEATLRRLYDAYPEALRLTTSSFGSTPLHLASMGSYPVAQRLFLSWWPEAMNVFDELGCAPIHQAIRCGSLDAIKMFVAAYPKCLSLTNPVTGETAMHHVARCFPDVDVENFLMSDGVADPAIFSMHDNNGETPLHVAVREGREELVQRILRRYPKAIEERVTPTGDTVFHVTIRRHNHQKMLQLLSKVWPDGAAIPNNKGMLPTACLERN